MNWPIQTFSINDIYLDAKNIRLPITDTSQEALLQDLFSNEEAFDVVKSYAQNGVFQDEFPIVTKENKKIIVIEGNRRLAALKALDNPDRIPSYKDRLKALKAKKIPKIQAIIAPNREAAMKLIAIKHTTTARRNWKPLRQAYFYKSQLDNGKSIDELKSTYSDVDLKKFIKFIEMHHLAKSIKYESDEITLKVHDDRKFDITNLERMYNDSDVQAYLGISFDINGFVKIHTTKIEFLAVYKILVEDVANGIIDSRKYNKGEQRQEYLENLPAEIKPTVNQKTSKTAASFKENKIDKEALSKIVRSTPTPKGLIPSYIPYKLQSSSLKILYKELRDISVKSFANASHDLLRSFFECSLIFYLKEINEYDKVKKNDKHTPSLSEMLSHISHDKFLPMTDVNLKQTIRQIKTDYDKPYSLERMNMINHNENWITTERDVRSAWSKLESLIKFLLNPNS